MIMKDVMGKFSRSGKLVLDAMDETLSLERVYPMPYKHRQLSRWDWDDDCHHKFMPSLVGVYACQVLANKSDLTDQNEQESAHVHQAAVKSKMLRESLDSHGCPPGLLAIQIFQEPLVSYLYTTHLEYSVLHLACQCPIWHGRRCGGWWRVWIWVGYLRSHGVHGNSTLETVKFKIFENIYEENDLINVNIYCVKIDFLDPILMYPGLA